MIIKSKKQLKFKYKIKLRNIILWFLLRRRYRFICWDCPSPSGCRTFRWNDKDRNCSLVWKMDYFYLWWGVRNLWKLLPPIRNKSILPLHFIFYLLLLILYYLWFLIPYGYKIYSWVVFKQKCDSSFPTLKE